MSPWRLLTGVRSYSSVSIIVVSAFCTCDCLAQAPQEVKWGQFKDVEPVVLDAFKKAMAGKVSCQACRHLQLTMLKSTVLQVSYTC